jgi:hypothetical protein
MHDCPQLEWKPTVVDGKHLRDCARDFLGKMTYEVGVVPGHHYLMWRAYPGLSSQGNFPTADAAKEAAQKEQERRWIAAQQ